VNINNAFIKVLNAGYTPDISKILDIRDDALIIGDFNAHEPAWYSTLSDSRGDSLSQQVDNSKFVVLNNDTPTRCPSNGNVSSPDVSLISVHLALAVTWCTHSALNSDHLPISITFVDDEPHPLRC
jgi:endonuclease/exonuclease/phosphatase family metal-dependent hydrolase